MVYRIVFICRPFDEGLVCGEFESEHVARHLCAKLMRDCDHFGTLTVWQSFTVRGVPEKFWDDTRG